MPSRRKTRDQRIKLLYDDIENAQRNLRQEIERLEVIKNRLKKVLKEEEH